MTVETLCLVDSSEASFDSYRHSIAQALEAGWRFGGTHVGADTTTVRTLLIGAEGGIRLISVTISGRVAPSIVDLIPAASWDEREAHDLHGISFAGHEPLRPLVNHSDRDRWIVPVVGSDIHQVAVGPIHAGIIESGHFRFHVVGDRIVHLDAQLFYKHRGLEKAAEGTDVNRAGRYIARACAACSVSNDLAYAHAWEQALGLFPTTELARVRTILLELERIWNFLNDLAAICAGAGFAAGNHHFAALTERARRLNAMLTGHRFLAGSVRVGGSDLTVDRDTVRIARDELAALRESAALGWREIAFSESFADRMINVGVVPRPWARDLGTVGPAARASGLDEDVRSTDTRLAYERFRAVASERRAGDVRARFEQRALELWQSMAIVERLLDGPMTSSIARPGDDSHPIGVGLVESPRGATSCVVERDGHTVTRVRLRTGSYANWPSVAYAAVGEILPDFPLINKSFELCYACVDR